MKRAACASLSSAFAASTGGGGRIAPETRRANGLNGRSAVVSSPSAETTPAASSSSLSLSAPLFSRRSFRASAKLSAVLIAGSCARSVSATDGPSGSAGGARAA